MWCVLVGFIHVEVMHCDANSAGCDRSQLHCENTFTQANTTFQYSNSRCELHPVREKFNLLLFVCQLRIFHWTALKKSTTTHLADENYIHAFMQNKMWISHKISKIHFLSSLIKGIVHWKKNMPSGHPKCRWVCFFIWTDLKKCSITSVAHQWILCSEWVPSEWESKQLIKTSQ